MVRLKLIPDGGDFGGAALPPFFFVIINISRCVAVSPYNKTSDVFSPEYKANTSRRIDFSADVITNTSPNIRLYTAFAMHIVGICPNIT